LIGVQIACGGADARMVRCDDHAHGRAVSWSPAGPRADLSASGQEQQPRLSRTTAKMRSQIETIGRQERTDRVRV
jgi:hypothetical protein